MRSAEPSLFDGPVYNPELDNARLRQQIGRVYALMLDGEWRTLDDIQAGTAAMRDDGGRDPHASISAQLRHLRKPRWGSHTIQKREAVEGSGLWEYRMIASACGLLAGTRDHQDSAPRCPGCNGTGRLAAS